MVDLALGPDTAAVARDDAVDDRAIAANAASSSRTRVTGNLTAIDWRDHNDTATAYNEG